MVLALLPYISTLFNSAKNWTRPDNVWRSNNDIDLIISCNINPYLCPPNCDHLPIITELDLTLSRAYSNTRPNFREASWPTFNEHLCQRLTSLPPLVCIASQEQFNQAVNNLSQALQDTINVKVPLPEKCLYTKHWWNYDLTKLCKQRNRASYEAFRLRDIPEHEAHQQFRDFSECYIKVISTAK